MTIGRRFPHWVAWVAVACGLLAACTTDRAINSPPIQDETGNTRIYDPHADGEAQLLAGLHRARREKKRVLLNLGANWCSDSQKMFRLLQDDPDLAREVALHFVLVLVDVNQRACAPRNSHLVARFENPLARGIPVLLVLAPDGALLNTNPSERLADSDHQNPARVLAYLRKWSVAPR